MDKRIAGTIVYTRGFRADGSSPESHGEVVRWYGVMGVTFLNAERQPLAHTADVNVFSLNDIEGMESGGLWGPAEMIDADGNRARFYGGIVEIAVFLKHNFQLMDGTVVPDPPFLTEAA